VREGGWLSGGVGKADCSGVVVMVARRGGGVVAPVFCAVGWQEMGWCGRRGCVVWCGAGGGGKGGQEVGGRWCSRSGAGDGGSGWCRRRGDGVGGGGGEVVRGGVGFLVVVTSWWGWVESSGGGEG